MTKQEILYGLDKLYLNKMTKKSGIMGIKKFESDEITSVEAAIKILTDLPDKYFDNLNKKL